MTILKRGAGSATVLGAALLMGGCAVYDQPGVATYPTYQSYPSYPAYSSYPAYPYYGEPAVVPGGYVGVDVYRERGPRYWGGPPPRAYPAPGYGRPGWNDRDNDRGRWRGAPPPQAQLPGVVPGVPVVPPRSPGGGGRPGVGGVPFGDPRVGTGTINPAPRQDSGNTP